MVIVVGSVIFGLCCGDSGRSGADSAVTSTDGPSNGTFACDYISRGTHHCQEDSPSKISNSYSAAYKRSCEFIDGKMVDKCPTRDLIGACTSVYQNPDDTLTQKIYFYAPNSQASTAEKACVDTVDGLVTSTWSKT